MFIYMKVFISINMFIYIKVFETKRLQQCNGGGHNAPSG